MQNYNDDKDNYYFLHFLIYFICVGLFDFPYILKWNMGHIKFILQMRILNFWEFTFQGL